MEEVFERFIADYDLSNSDIKLKYNHSYRVADLQVKYAKLLGFNKEDIEIAKIIGLLHDIGRFEQLKNILLIMILNLWIMPILVLNYYLMKV